MKLKKFSGESFFYLLLFLIVCYPVSCGYLMDTGNIREWTVRVSELAGDFSHLLFPSDALILEQNAQLSAMNSNLWFLLPALIVKLTGSTFAAWCVFQLLLQATTIGTVSWMGRALFSGEDAGDGTCFLTALYGTCPYRIYICYDAAELSQAVVWLLLPLYIGAVVRFLHGDGACEKREKVLSCGIAAMALTGIAYADVMHFLILTGMTILAVLLIRGWKLLPALPISCVLSAPVLLRLGRYAFAGAYAELNLPLSSISGNGYLPGEMLHMFLFHDEHPGLGLGLMAGLLCGIWLMFVKNSWKRSRMCRLFVGMSVFLLVLSLQAFPWEVVQRLGTWALKLVSLLGTPAVFFGMAQPGLCVAGALSVNRLREQSDDEAAKGIPFAVLLACAVCCVYQCNLLVYDRMPL